MSESSPTNPRRGDLLALTSAIFAAVFLLAFRAANAEAPRAAAVLAMLGWSTLFNAGVALVRARGGRAGWPRRVTVRAAAVLAVLTILGNVGVAGALEHLDPGLTSTVLQTQIFVVGLGGWLLLGERVGVRFFVGAGFALAGFALLGMDDPREADVSLAGLGFALLASTSFGGMLLYTRKVIRRIDPVTVNVFRLVLAVAALGAWLIPRGTLDGLSTELWLATALAAACGPFASRLCLMFAVRHISAARTKLITLLSPVFAFALEIAWLGTFPSARELAGGGLILAGVLLPMLADRARRRPGSRARTPLAPSEDDAEGRQAPETGAER
ncbi:MAG TPA: DMT family transporter [Polyangiaceae bacterium LLY-WYZ-15_(1-7)]|nr:DMT family transporter [Polyangiaceae bacterium LLY-WYZ-15_(1-7)]HJL11265.1 DMT family transporter [Polyangiaceae bacterium LLY-WYZ-15_(1-7)]HJL36945.1 DMT family transporter [Polyangiaceae bacterium LLY-WYZ-15_(1-7)]